MIEVRAEAGIIAAENQGRGGVILLPLMLLGKKLNRDIIQSH